MKIALVPGSFDPFSLGHLSIVERAARMFDKVYVTVMQNDKKQYLFTAQERLFLVKKAISHIKNAEADFYGGMLWEYARDKKINAIVKGIRNAEDLQYETEMAEFNASRYPGAVTVFLPAEPGKDVLSSTKIREILQKNESIEGLVPQNIENEIKQIYRGKNR